MRLCAQYVTKTRMEEGFPATDPALRFTVDNMEGRIILPYSESRPTTQSKGIPVFPR